MIIRKLVFWCLMVPLAFVLALLGVTLRGLGMALDKLDDVIGTAAILLVEYSPGDNV